MGGPAVNALACTGLRAGAQGARSRLASTPGRLSGQLWMGGGVGGCWRLWVNLTSVVRCDWLDLPPASGGGRSEGGSNGRRPAGGCWKPGSFLTGKRSRRWLVFLQLPATTHPPLAAKPARRAGETQTRPLRTGPQHSSGKGIPTWPPIPQGRSLASETGWSGPSQGWPAGPSPQATRSAAKRPLLGPWKPDTDQEASGPTSTEKRRDMKRTATPRRIQRPLSPLP
jgi:hypothetical protein